MERRQGIVAVFMGSFMLQAAVLLADPGVVRYLETHGTKSTVVELRIEKNGASMDVISSGGSAADRTRWVPGTGTVSWQETDTEAGTDLSAERNGNTIRLTGVLKGKKVSRDVRIDDAPWYQIFGPAIADLLPPELPRREFWVVNPDDLAPHKMLASRAGTDRIDLTGRKLDSYKVHFSPAGALAPFWGADFWYRASDWTYLYSRLPENGGVTVTTIQDTGAASSG